MIQPIDLKEILGKVALVPDRQCELETFEEYKRRRKNNNKLIDAYLKGRFINITEKK